jgi:hypothetical protein
MAPCNSVDKKGFHSKEHCLMLQISKILVEAIGALGGEKGL